MTDLFQSELSNEVKRHDRKYSELRVTIGHTASGIKKFGMSTELRFDHASDIVSGLLKFSQIIVRQPSLSSQMLVK